MYCRLRLKMVTDPLLEIKNVAYIAKPQNALQTHFN